MTQLEAHPVADLFPMLAADELAELAADIKARGLLHPIVLDAQGRVLDGRNRLAACELAGVEPEFETYDGNDPAGFALAVNGQRRSQTRAQKALVAAMALLSNTKIDKTDTEVAAALGVSRPLVSQAMAIMTYARDLGEQILQSRNGTGFAEAREVATERKAEADRAKADTARLRADAPDLLALVDEERMALADAVAALEAREEKARQEADAAAREAAARASEQERQRRVLEQERQESLERDRERIRSVISGWSTMRDLILKDPDGEHAAEIVAGLGESDQLALKRIVADLTEKP